MKPGPVQKTGRSELVSRTTLAAFTALALVMVFASCELLYIGADPVAEVVSAVVESTSDSVLAGYLDVGYRVTNYGTKSVPSGSRVEFTALLYDISLDKQVAVDFWAAALPIGGLPPGRSFQGNVSADYYMQVDIGNVDASRSKVVVRGVKMRP